jgi:hypothetical protein
MRRKQAGFIAAQAAVFVVVIALVSLPLLPANSSASNGNTSNMGQNGLQLYSDNGITCQLRANSPSYVTYLVPRVVQSPIFLSATNGAPYLFGDSSNMTNRIETAGGTTVHLPPAVELSFYTYGPGTSCGGQPPPPSEFLAVVVPLEDGSFNLTGMQIIPTPGGYYPAPASGG